MGEAETHCGTRDVCFVGGDHLPNGSACVVREVDVCDVGEKGCTVAFEVCGGAARSRWREGGEPVVAIGVVRNAAVVIEANYPAVVVAERVEKRKECIGGTGC